MIVNTSPPLPPPLPVPTGLPPQDTIPPLLRRPLPRLHAKAQKRRIINVVTEPSPTPRLLRRRNDAVIVRLPTNTVTQRELPPLGQERRHGLHITARCLESEIRAPLDVVPGGREARFDVSVAVDAGVDVGLDTPPAGIGDVGDGSRVEVLVWRFGSLADRYRCIWIFSRMRSRGFLFFNGWNNYCRSAREPEDWSFLTSKGTALTAGKQQLARRRYMGGAISCEVDMIFTIEMNSYLRRARALSQMGIRSSYIIAKVRPLLGAIKSMSRIESVIN